MAKIGLTQRFSRKSQFRWGAPITTRPGLLPGPGLAQAWGLAAYCFLIILALGGRNNYLFIFIYFLDITIIFNVFVISDVQKSVFFIWFFGFRRGQKNTLKLHRSKDPKQKRIQGLRSQI